MTKVFVVYEIINDYDYNDNSAGASCEIIGVYTDPECAKLKTLEDSDRTMKECVLDAD